MTIDDERRKMAEALRDEAKYGDVNAFDLACILQLTATSRTSYNAEDVKHLADLLDPHHTSNADTDTWQCPSCGGIWLNGLTCPVCGTEEN